MTVEVLRHPVRSALVALRAIVIREAMKLLSQRGRFLAALVRPLLWLLVFATGFRAVLGLSITPPYQTYITYETYIVPGLCAMVQLFYGMQSSLGLVYDRQMGSMRLLLTSPLPRWWLLLCKLLAGAVISVAQVYAFLLVAALAGVVMSLSGYILVFPVLVVSGLALGALGMALSSFVRQLENFAAVTNFVIFPMFFLSSALYPLWRIGETSPFLRDVCLFNPFTHIVEMIRFTLYEEFNFLAMVVSVFMLLICLFLALWGYDARRIARSGGVASRS